MKAFRWDPCFLTGLPTVDEQHHALVDIINQFGDARMRPQGASAQEVEALFQELTRYTLYHFREEEALMKQRGVYPSHIAHQRHEHAQFVQDILRMHSGIAGDDRDPATATLLQAMHQLVHQLSERSRALFELNQTLEARVSKRTQALSALNQRLETIAMTDVLTSLPNRRQALQVLEREWQAATESGAPLACMMIDADGFKKINDTCGHDASDAVLRELARCLQNAVRNDDLVCRLGGDEFLIICAHTPLEGALETAEKVRAEVAALRVPAGDGVWIDSISIGVAARQSDMPGFEALLKTADDGAYAAKAYGRDCVASVQSVT